MSRLGLVTRRNGELCLAGSARAEAKSETRNPKEEAHGVPAPARFLIRIPSFEFRVSAGWGVVNGTSVAFGIEGLAEEGRGNRGTEG